MLIVYNDSNKKTTILVNIQKNLKKKINPRLILSPLTLDTHYLFANFSI